MAAQTALVTGASSGIGQALAREFASKGFNIVAVARQEDKLESAMERLQADYGVPVTLIAKDLTLPESAREIHDELKLRNIVVDVLINDAGVGQRELFHSSDIDKDIEIIRLNIEALTRLTRIFLGDMVKRGRGRVLNVGSVAGFQPGPLLAVYHASKAFVVSFSEAIAEELKDSGVTVTVLCPGPTDTDFFRRADMENAQVLEKGIVMEPEEVAKVGYEATMAGERIVIPGISNRMMTFTRRLIPLSLQAKINKKFYEVNVG